MEMPSDLKVVLDQHKTELQMFAQEKAKQYRNLYITHPQELLHGLTDGQGVIRFDWLPNYYIKYHVNRIEGAHILKESFKNNNLDALAVPNKYLYPLYGDTYSITDANYLVIAEKIKKNRNKVLNYEHVKQLIALHKITGFDDLHSDNLILADDNKCYIIDTGGPFSSLIKRPLKNFISQYDYFYKLAENPMTDEARKAIDNLIKAEEKKVWYYTTAKITTAICGIGIAISLSKL